MAKGRHVPRPARRRWPLIVGLVAGVLVLALGGVAYATFRYEQANADRLLRGITVGGVDVSGMTRSQALAEVRARARADLDREIIVVAEGQRFTTTARELGRKAWVGRAVDEAIDASAGVGWVERAWRRLRDEPLDLDIELSLGGEGRVEAFIRRTAREVSVDPRNASIEMGDDGGLVFRQSKAGSALDVGRAERLLARALGDGSSRVRLPMHRVAPKITVRTMLPTIVVHVDTNRLDLYEGFEVTHSWDVATAKPGWTTPVGEWSLYQKRENPTWYNPACRGSRRARQPDGHPCAVHHRARPHPDPRDDLARLDRSLRVARVHPDAQRAGRGAVRHGPRRGEGDHHGRPPLVGIRG
jgi:hypothetical protein